MNFNSNGMVDARRQLVWKEAAQLQLSFPGADFFDVLLSRVFFGAGQMLIRAGMRLQRQASAEASSNQNRILLSTGISH